jgi:6-phosphogluconolactonase
VTLSLPALNSCREMLFEVTDSGKRAILARVLEGDNLPAARAHATDETVWLVEKAAVPESFNES